MPRRPALRLVVSRPDRHRQDLPEEWPPLPRGDLVARQRALVERQRMLIARLRELGLPTEAARHARAALWALLPLL